MLFFDPNGLNRIAQNNQYIFTEWDPSAKTDLDALRSVFDTNHDGVLNASDAIDRLTARQSAQRIPTPVKRVGKTQEKPNKINRDLFNWRAGQDETANSYVVEIAV